MSQDKIDMLQRALAREKAARKQAEKILENKAAELYEAKQKLEKSYTELEALLNRKDSELQGVFENIVDAYVIMDLWGKILKMNDAAVSLLGFQDSKVDFNLLEMVHPDEMERVAESFQSLMKNGTITDFHLNIISQDKAQKLVHINASVIYDNGQPVAAQGIVRDITEVKAAEEKLIESENRLATLILNLDSGVLLEDENRKIVLTNNKFCELFQVPVSPEQLKGADCSTAAEQNKILFKEPQFFVDRINTILKEKKQVVGDELEMSNGKILLRDYIPIYENDNYKGHLWAYKDVTLRRKYRKSLEAQKQKYSSIIANMNLGLMEVDNDDRILMVNQSFLDITGYKEDELVGKIARNVFLDRDNSEILSKENFKRKKGLSNSYEVKGYTKTGEERYWLISGAPNYNLNGEVTGSIGIHLDITDLKSLQAQKERLLEKLEKSNNELQEYAHIVSHDLKSPLRSIDALVNWIKDDNKDRLDEVSLQNFNLIETTLEKMEQLISDVLMYSSVGAETLERETVDLDVLISDLKTILFVPDHVSISVLNPLPKVKGEKVKLQQLFQNLISNAIKFIDKDVGLVEIDVKDKVTDYEFSIKDNGIGIEEKFHEKIFKIFHALNKSKDSTGIGLSIVKKIVDLHEGQIWLESKPNEGTTFFFTLKK
ncbi:PAS domain S-box protein [Seonamhaeicola sediminis]|uniref:histidine kinase n=1 Tax=Seonamhaeicola sediminis TaxID=2528206 RepID=A0A562YDF9_9FLAO|nr:PAS domain S-box protein [Seonamhaeicola sediminis]TWO32707.1 PAS domain S-box protein [Seonamhaeicola sediminis]